MFKGKGKVNLFGIGFVTGGDQTYNTKGNQYDKIRFINAYILCFRKFTIKVKDILYL